MARPKLKQGSRKGFYLDAETIEQIKRNASINEMSESQYVDFLVQKENLSQNPVAQIKDIQLKKEQLQVKITELDKKEKEAVDHATWVHRFQEAKRNKLPTALKFISEKILQKDMDGIETAAKAWSRMTGVPAVSLIIQAQKKIEGDGI